VWSLNPENEGFEQLEHRIRAFAAMMLSPRNIKYEFTAAEELEKLYLTGEQCKNIFLIFKEALHNAVKYAACETVRISLGKESNHLVMVIQDDGVGFNVAARSASDHSSNGFTAGTIGGSGIKNMYARAAAMDAKLYIDSKENEGTIVSLVVSV
jgi:signal transduction histidine kinase